MRTLKRINWGVVAMVLLLIVSIGFAVKINSMNTVEEVKATAFEKGTIDTATGKNETSKTAIRTKDYISTDGLKITVDKDAEVKYQVVFYDKEKAVIADSATEASASDLDAASIPETAKYCKIVITFSNGDEVGTTDVRNMAKQLTITHNKASK